MKILILFIAIFHFTFVFAQDISITGKVVDSTTRENLPFCNIMVTDYKDSLIRGLITNVKGEFNIKLQQKFNFDSTTYFLHFSFFGYNSKKIPMQIGNENLNIGTVYLAASAFLLGEVEINDTKNIIEFRYDKKIFTISESKKSAANSIYDLLKTLPGVVVDENNTVKYKGEKANIYVDNQSADYIYPELEMIPVDNIAKIELIDLASRSGLGKGGIINIVMKRNYKEGFSGLYSQRGSVINFKNNFSESSFININFRKKNMQLFTNSYLLYDLVNPSSSTKGVLSIDSNTYLINEQSDNLIKQLYPFISSGMVFKKNKTKITFINHFFYGTFTRNLFTSTSKNLPEGSNIDYYSIKNNDQDKIIYNASRFSLYKEIDTSGTIFSFNTTLKYNIVNGDYLSNYEFINPTLKDSASTLDRDIYIKRTDLTSDCFVDKLIFKKKMRLFSKFEFSGRLREKLNYNINSYYNITNAYIYKNENQLQNYSISFYNRIGKTFKKYNIDLGITAELNKTKSEKKYFLENFRDTVYQGEQSFLNLLPSSTLSYLLTDNQEIKLTYNCSKINPYINDLFTYIDKQDPRNWTTGNPKLKTEIYNNIYLGYTLNKDKWNFSYEIFYTQTNNSSTTVTYPISFTTTLSIPENIAIKKTIGNDAAIYFSATKNINLNVSFSLFDNYINTSALKQRMLELNLPTDNLIKNDFGYNIKFNTDIKITKKITGIFYATYYSKELVYNGYRNNYVSSSISFNWKMAENWNFAGGVYNLLDELYKQGSTNKYAGYNIKVIENNGDYKRRYYFNVRYTFGKGDRGTKDLILN